ncbi:hypothetical protein [Sphaerochaeta sp. PS]|uniref:hypothetical protein n=1 Tax=Sphaerochaeta sp. PS TaxID=3076336 RepID=UPI0028A4E7FA|nr:hypothetical protein [Sphaerochaeta sp. PS]MDT4762148.1 hypothetical protein [Sphaerochaeta sp. PS]
MDKRKIRILLVVTLAILSLSPLSARSNNVAVGFQAGFAATGFVVDVGLGPLYLNAGLNYPLGYSYIAANTDPSEAFPKLATVTLDVSTAFPLSDSFDLKLGFGGIALTDFGPSFGGLAGPVIKGEYWIPNKNYGLFLNINVPILLFGVLVGDYDEENTAAVLFSPLLPLLGLLTTTVGVLYSF